MYKAKPKLQQQFNVCDKDQIPFAVIIGGSEIEKGIVKIKDMRKKESGDAEKEVEIERKDMVKELCKRLGRA